MTISSERSQAAHVQVGLLTSFLSLAVYMPGLFLLSFRGKLGFFRFSLTWQTL